jgi:uncharacterized protein YjbJ (UPF0337 family)
MNWEHIKADWSEVKGKVKSKWGKLTDNDVMLIDGKWDQLVGKLRHHYGYDKDRAEREVDDFLNEGEGSRTAAREYDAGAARAASDKERTQKLANDAQKALEGPEGDALREAERSGKAAKHR